MNCGGTGSPGDCQCCYCNYRPDCNCDLCTERRGYSLPPDPNDRPVSLEEVEATFARALTPTQAEAQEAVFRKRKVRRALVAVVKHQAAQKCNRKNCGTVCLCPSCHARVALEWYEEHGRWP